MYKKSLFISKTIRQLNKKEKQFLCDVKNVINLKSDISIVSYLPGYISSDRKVRPLLLSKDIVLKITVKHGYIHVKNLLINAHDWDYVIQNLDRDKDKINLIKLIPNSNNFLLIGAVKNNGFFMLTHFETEVIKGNELKSLLGRGDMISKDARPGSFISSIETSSLLEGVSNVIDNDNSINLQS